MKRLSVAALVLVPLCGCVGPQRSQQFVKEGVQAVHEIPRATIGAARAQQGADQAILDVYEENLEQRIGAQNIRLEQIRKDIEEQQRRWRELVVAIAKIAGNTVPGGAPIVQSFIDAFEKTKAEASAHADGVKAALEGRVGGIDGKLDDLTESVRALQEDARTEQKVGGLNAQLLETKLNERLASIEGFDQEAFKAEVQRQTEALVKLEGRELKDAVIQEMREAGFTQEQVQFIENMTPDALKTVLGGGGIGGLIGLLALARTFGPSRGKKELAVLEAQFRNLKEQIPTTTGGAVAGATNRAPGSTG